MWDTGWGCLERNVNTQRIKNTGHFAQLFIIKENFKRYYTLNFYFAIRTLRDKT